MVRTGLNPKILIAHTKAAVRVENLRINIIIDYSVLSTVR